MTLSNTQTVWLIIALLFVVSACIVYFVSVAFPAPTITRRYEVYRHYKGGTYAVLYTGRTEHDDKKCVIYCPVLQLDNPIPWVREYNEFHDGRFEYIGTITYPGKLPITEEKE